MDAELFDRVADFVARELGVRRERIRPETLVEDDLGCSGYDAADFIEAFAREFGLDLTGFEFDRHFGPEEAATPWSLLRGLAIWAATGRRGDPSPDPVTVARLAKAAARGRWADSGAAGT
jgi:acyl carrier protein